MILTFKYFYGHSFRLFKKSSCQLMVKECMLSNGKLSVGGLHRKNVVRITDLADMTVAVYCGCKATNQTKHLTLKILIKHPIPLLDIA